MSTRPPRKRSAINPR
jgi:chromosome segregation ATPase